MNSSELNKKIDLLADMIEHIQSYDIDSILKRIENLEDKIVNVKETLTLLEAAEFTGLKSSYLYRLTSDRKIPHYKPQGKILYFDREDLLDWMRQNRISSKLRTDSK